MAEVAVKEEPMDYEFISASGTMESHGNTPQPKVSCTNQDPVLQNNDEKNLPESIFEQVFIKEELEGESLASVKKDNSALQTSQDDDVKPPENDVINDVEVFNIQEEVEITIDDVKIEDDNWRNELYPPDETKEVEPKDQCSKQKSVENTQEDVQIALEGDKIQKENELFPPVKTKEVELKDQCSKQKSVENTQEDVQITLGGDKIQKENMMDEETVEHPTTGPSQASVGILTSHTTQLTSHYASKGVIWNYFTKENRKEAKCSICSLTFKTPTGVTSSLIRHLENKHATVHIKYLEEKNKNIASKQGKNKFQPSTATRSRPTTTAVIWKHFSKTNRMEAKCRICSRTLKTPTGVTSSLIRHIQNKHLTVYKKYSKEQNKIIGKKQKFKFQTARSHLKSRSVMWNHFTRESQNEAKCKICSKTLKTTSGTTSSLFRHLEKKHLTVYRNNCVQEQNKNIESKREIKKIIVPTAVNHSKPKSVMWNHFTRESQNEAKCKICSKTLKTTSGTTSPLFRHLEKKHPTVDRNNCVQEQNKNIESKLEKQNSNLPTPPNQEKTDGNSSFTDKWADNHPRSKTITNAIVKWMAKSCHPYSLVEEEGFKHLMSVLQPKYAIPSQNTFSRIVIPELYRETKKRIEDNIKQNIHDITSLSITTDLWTSDSNDPLISVTGHYADSDFSIQSYCLGSSYFTQETNGGNINTKLTKMLNAWGLHQSDTMPIFCITDNDQNMISAVALTPWIHLRCFANNLQLALDDAKKELDGMETMLSKARSIVSHSNHCSAVQFRLNKIQEQFGKVPIQLTNETTWNSEYKMLSCLVDLKQAISDELATSSKLDSLSLSEWELVEDYIQILKEVDDAITLSSTGFLLTLSTVLPFIDGLKVSIKKFIATGKKGMFARALDKSINLRFPYDQYFKNKLYLLAMMVDPRYKSLILMKNKKLAVDILEQEALEFYSPQAGPAAATTSSSSGSQEAVSNEDFSMEQHSQTLPQKPQTELSKKIMVSYQVEAYLDAPSIGIQENPFEWWKKNHNLFGLVASVAKRYLGIPATKVPCERVGNVIGEWENSLNQDNISEMVFLHYNT